jgi:hypothetical protein
MSSGLQPATPEETAELRAEFTKLFDGLRGIKKAVESGRAHASCGLAFLADYEAMVAEAKRDMGPDHPNMPIVDALQELLDGLKKSLRTHVA